MSFNYNGSDSFVTDVRLRSQTDSVLGGLNNPANVASQDLADCTAYLKAQDVRDMKNQVESASGGTATVRQDAAGLIDYFHIIEKFKPSDVDSDMGDYTGLFAPTRLYHPAFYVNGTLKDQILMGIFTSDLETVSGTDYFKQAINTDPLSDEYTISQIRLLCSNKGTGYHLMNYLEYAAAGILSLERIADLKGNDALGRSAGGTTNDTIQGRIVSDSTNTGICYAGSGGLPWRHNNQPYGIADLVGNVAQVLDGIYMNLGQLYLFSTRDNNYTEAETSYTATSIYYDPNGLDISLNTSATAGGAVDKEFTSVGITAGLVAAGNPIVDCTYIVDALLGGDWNKATVITQPALLGSVTLGKIDIQALTTKDYMIAGGDYQGASGYGLAGLGARYFESDSTVLHGRCCLIE